MNFIETKLPKEIYAMCLKVTKAARRVNRSKNLTLKRAFGPFLENAMLDLLTNPSKQRVWEIGAMLNALGMTLKYLNRTPTFDKNR